MVIADEHKLKPIGEKMMILSTDLKSELMFNPVVGRGYRRPLTKEEYFNVISDKYSEDTVENASILMEKCIEYGIELEEMLEFAFRRAGW